MTLRPSALFSASIFLSLAGVSTAAEPAGATLRFAPDVFGGYASTHVMVKLRQGVDMADPAITATLAGWQVVTVEPATPGGFQYPEAAARIGLDRWYRVHVPAGTDTPAMAAELSALTGRVEVAEFAGVGGVAQIPNDQSFGELYGMHNTGQNVQGQSGVNDADIDAPEAWDLNTGVDSITVAVIDSGVMPHPEFGNRLVPGWNTVNNNNIINDSCAHGTHVAGTVGARGHNGIGVAGVSSRVNIMPVQVLSGCGGNTDDCADGILWAVDHGADIGTMSLQYYDFSQYFEDSVAYAEANDVVLIAATGNNQGNRVAYPAKFPWTIGVGATTNRDERAGFSNYGPEIDVSAAGENVYSTQVNNGYGYLSGTSMATPHVAGLASLIWSYNPTLTAHQVHDILINAVNDLGTNGWDQFFGNGRINARIAMNAARMDRMELTVSPLVAGQPATARVTGATPGGIVSLHYTRRGPGATEVVDLGVTLEIESAQVVLEMPADANGEALFTGTIRDTSGGTRRYMQAAELGNVSDVEVREIPR